MSRDVPPAPRIVVAEPLTILGKEVVAALPALSGARVTLVASGDGEGTLTEYDGEPIVVQGLGSDALEEADAVLVCGPSPGLDAALARAEAPARVTLEVSSSGIDPSGAEVVVAGVNERAARRSRSLRIPHPAAVLAAKTLHALGSLSGIARASVLAFEPVCLLGEAGVDELYRQTIEVLSFRPPPTDVLGARIAFDLLPRTGPRGVGAVERVADDLRRVLGPGGPRIGVTLLGAPIFLGAAALVVAELEDAVEGAAVRAALGEAPSLRLHEDGPPTPGSLPEEDGRDLVHVAVLDGEAEDEVRLWVVGDAMRRCAALEAVEVVASALAGR